MGRHANPSMTKSWKIHVDATIAGRVELLLLDPLTAKPRYGKRGELVNELLRKWVEEEEQKLKTAGAPVHA